MCGIAGFLNLYRSNFSLDASLLDDMQRTIAHRGPDGYRIWKDERMQLGIVHRRLSIIDLSDAGFQPLFDTEKTIAVCCNGEIYNHATLRKELESYGYRFQSHSDTEVIVYAYKHWGISFLEKLQGMFAIVIADLKKQELYLVRDRIGVKPFYFSLQGEILSFASEIKALWKLPWISRTINQQGLYHYLTYMVTPAPMTLYQRVYKLPAGFYLKVSSDKKVTFTQWYTPLLSSVSRHSYRYDNEQECIDTIRSLLGQAVQKRLIADVPFGAFLSGGIDSSLIVALMAQYTDNIKTFNVSFSDGPEFSEIEWARKVAKQFNTDHHEIIISEKEAFNFFEKMVYHQDEPLADCVCIPLYFVSQLLKNAGVTVALVGEGADELFCGYSSYARYIDFYNKYWNPSQKFIPAFAKKTMYHCASTLFPGKLNYLDKLKNWSENRSLFWSGAVVFTEEGKKSLYRSDNYFYPDPIVEAVYPGFNQSLDSYAIVDYHLKQLKTQIPSADFLTSMIYLELKQRLPELLLGRVDKMTMATSVEARVPFLDHALVEYAFHMPSHYKYRNGTTKYILKKVAQGLIGDDVIYRKKIGFAAPTMRWFKQGQYFKPYFEQLLHDKKQLWSPYINLDYVHNLFNDNQSNKHEASMHLWTLQNLIACNISDAL
jgi:asparagine synthase (glutamine-hydrolysing)